MAFLQQGIMPFVVWFILKFYTFVCAGYCLIPFVYLSFYKWWAIYKKFYFIGHIIIVPMSFVWKPLIVKVVNYYFPIEKKVADENTIVSADGEKNQSTTKREKEN